MYAAESPKTSERTSSTAAVRMMSSETSKERSETRRSFSMRELVGLAAYLIAKHA